MIENLLKAFQEGRLLSLDDLMERLGLSAVELMMYMDFLEKQSYIEKMNTCEGDACKSCNKCIRPLQNKGSTMWVLTRKGQKTKMS